MSLKILCFTVSFLLFSTLYAQQDSVNIILNDSLTVQIDSVIAAESGLNPKQIALLSLGLPGAGHIYNKKYWKAPLVYTAMGATIFYIDRNTKAYKVLQTAYCDALVRESFREMDCADAPSFIANNTTGSGRIYGFSSPNWQGILESQSTKTSTSLKNTRDDFDKLRQLSWIGLVAVHLVFNTAWSFVDAHLLDFDLDDDLSLRLHPSVQSVPLTNAPAIGFGVSIPLDTN